MNQHIDDVVSEITCMNNVLNSDSTFDDFVKWIQYMLKVGVDREEYPNFNMYSHQPAKYWQFVKRRL